MPSDGPELPEGLSIGEAITFLRRQAGMPQRELTRRLGLSARSNLSDYELGRRVPPQDIVLACEKLFDLREGELQQLRQQLLSERARAAAQGPPGEEDADVAPVSPAPAPEPPAQPIGAGPPDSLAGSGRRRRLRALVLLAVGMAALGVLGGAAAMRMASRDGSGGRVGSSARDSGVAVAAPVRGATPQPVRSAPRDLSHHDGDDPLITGCGQDVVTQAEATVYLPGGAVFGHLLLRHSRACEMSWGAVWGPDPHLYRVYIIARRPRDHAAEPSSWAANTPPGSYGNMLSTVPGCVQVSAYVQTPAGNGPAATTSCHV